MPIFDVSNKTVLISGASGHIGQVLVKALAKEGAKVWSLDLIPLPENLREMCVGEVVVDLADEAALEQKLMAADIPELHGFVHAAAFVGTSNLSGWLGNLQKQSRQTFDNALAVNVGSAFTIVKALEPSLKNASLVFISSIYGQFGPDMSLYEGTTMDNPAAYGVSKAGLEQFARYVAARYGRSGIRANSIMLGGVLRGQPASFVQRYEAKTALGRMAVETDLIGPVQFLLSDASSYMTGATLALDGGYSIT